MLIGAALVAMVASPRELSFALVSRARSLFLRALSQLVSARTPHSRAGEPSSEARTEPSLFFSSCVEIPCSVEIPVDPNVPSGDAMRSPKEKQKKKKIGGKNANAVGDRGGGVLIECTTSPDTPIPTRHLDRQGASAEVGE